MYYTVYKTTNLITDMCYIGLHQTNDLEDSYIGSGSLLKKDVAKYGKENFKKEILHVFESEQEMIEKEIELVSEEFCKRDDTYNLMPGGRFGSYKRNGLTFLGRIHSEETKQHLSEHFVGTKHSNETKEKMSRNNFSKRDPERQKRAASAGGKLSTKNPQKISESLKKFFADNPEAKGGFKNKGKPKERLTCPHCYKEIAINTAHRWHYDNCKHRES